MSFNDYIVSELIKNKKLSEKNAKDYAAKAKKDHGSIITILYDENVINEEYYYKALAKFIGVDFSDYNSFNINASIARVLPISYILENRILPIEKIDGHIIVVLDSLKKLSSLDSLKYFYKDPIKVEVVTKSKLDLLINSITSSEKRIKANQDLEIETNKENKKKGTSFTLDDYLTDPAIVYADNLLVEAVSLNASDIHIEPFAKDVRIRLRVDGVLINYARVESNLYPALLARYKILSNLDISEHRIPQDGKISEIISGRNYDFRISTLPNIYGEKIVIRIYDTNISNLTIETIANNKEEATKIRHMIEAPHGIIFLTGPTGSGKTTTLYAFLKELNKEGINIQTVEDPVENQINGINQLQVNPKAGLTFSKALRSILRQDPNVIMIGEIRDEETAHIAVQAAITGHLVLSTIHTNDAITTITRLIDMNVEPYLVLDSMVGAISQRLVKKLCPHCKKEHKVDANEAKLLDVPVGTKIYEPGGCSYCNNTGYAGRTAVFEILVLNQKFKNKVDVKKISTESLYNIAVENGYVTIDKSCRRLVLEGVTSIEEYIKLINLNETID